MKTILISANQKIEPVDPFWASTVFQLAFSASGAKNLKNSAAGTLQGAAAMSTALKLPGSTHSLRLPGASADYLSFANDVSYLPGTADFTIEWFEKIDSIPTNSADSSKLVPILYWGTYAKAGHAVNMDVYISQTSGAAVMGLLNGTHTDVASQANTGSALSLTAVEHCAIVRRSGQIAFYRNGVRVAAPAAYTRDMTNTVNSVLQFGRRVGGNSANVFWNVVGYLLGFRITKASRYWGDSFTVPEKFYVPS